MSDDSGDEGGYGKTQAYSKKTAPPATAPPAPHPHGGPAYGAPGPHGCGPPGGPHGYAGPPPQGYAGPPPQGYAGPPGGPHSHAGPPPQGYAPHGYAGPPPQGYAAHHYAPHGGAYHTAPPGHAGFVQQNPAYMQPPVGAGYPPGAGQSYPAHTPAPVTMAAPMAAPHHPAAMPAPVPAPAPQPAGRGVLEVQYARRSMICCCVIQPRRGALTLVVDGKEHTTLRQGMRTQLNLQAGSHRVAMLASGVKGFFKGLAGAREEAATEVQVRPSATTHTEVQWERAQGSRWYLQLLSK